MSTSTERLNRPDLAWTMGDRMAKARKVLGLTQAEMADRLEVSRQSVVNYENDHTRPYRRTLRQWAEITGVTTEWITGPTRDNGWLSAHIPQPRGHIGRGLLGSWDHHYQPRSVA
jgi:transcriptional regulator with XRE-family HTH domain